MPAPYSSTLACAFSLVLLTLVNAVAQAEPKLEMHRAGVSADDGPGWNKGVSTKGSFSISVPIPFNDFTTYDNGKAGHIIGGKSSNGIKFMAAELPNSVKTPADLEAIPKTFASNPANTVSDIRRQAKDGIETLSFSVAGADSGGHFRYIRTKTALYMLSIEYPNAYHDVATATKSKFFDSFELKPKS
jgi:hypothetical protein